MIHGVYANQSSFHPIEFTSGLNVVLAERTRTSTPKDTRNGLGKSTLIEIIDFCLGGGGEGLRIEALKDWAFTLDLTVAGNRIKATRSIESPTRIIVAGQATGWVEQPDIDRASGAQVFNLDRWKRLLGWALFGLPRTDDTHKYKPSYRSLISYFIRQGPNAYIDPFSHYRQQKTWDIQLHVGFLLGLNWENAAKWQELKDQEQALNAVSQAIKTGAMEGAGGSLGELETDRVQLEGLVETESHALANFKVHPQYEAIQKEADRKTVSLHELTNQNIADRRILARYKESVAKERPPSCKDLEKLYAEMGALLPDLVGKTLAEAIGFHQKIVQNRKAFLEAEITRLERQILLREDKIKTLTEDRACNLEVLRTHGALQEMIKFQERLVAYKSRLDRVLARISEIKDLTSRKRDINMAKTALTKVAEQDHEERRDTWTTAVRLFNDNSQALYETPGRLIIGISETGYKYNVEIERSGSEGIGKMKIFCFDLMLLQLILRQKGRIDFLIHDSVLYDGVDSRQRAFALERASKITNEIGGQYICTLNSDMIPREDFSEGFDFDKHIRLTLTDKEESGRLLGLSFERNAK